MKPNYTIVATIALLSGSLWGQTVDFVRDVRPLWEKHCYACHSGDKQESGFRLDVREEALRGGDRIGPDIVPFQPERSPLIELVTSQDDDQVMPPKGPRLSPKEVQILKDWIKEGAVWPVGVDRVKLEDKRDHWAFRPLSIDSTAHSIDDFIDRRLRDFALERSRPADPVAWLRRVTMSLTGLPATVAEWEDFRENLGSTTDSDIAYQNVVDRLLSSPRYGERWAQHWLDVVRYADTHGFEVNTERPNAWPYRDYVVRAFNDDTPYDRFILEQMAGDALGKDAATGFLITASVLLPGQIGKDAPSIRLARQDAIDEIVNNIGQTFLGLSIGCARCHDHKFDPIRSRDYYAMQAFVAGVEYEDREIRTPEAEDRKREVTSLQARLRQLDDRLAEFAPLAKPGSRPTVTDARENAIAFAPCEAKHVRFTIHDANLHPSLGLIEPCIDEFEIYGDSAPRVNLALAERGTQVVASGSRSSGSHGLSKIHDGQYGNGSSWMSDEKGKGWVLLTLSQPTTISKVVWSRDRTGKFTDRLATAFTLEAGMSLDSMQTLASSSPLRPAVNRRMTIDRFQPVQATKLRLEIRATNSLGPCIDELEVLNANGVNVALATGGTKVRTSGDILSPNRHDPRFLNDGLYGNERSWLGNMASSGWVELEFAQAETIAKVVWSRDRVGALEDRLPIEYVISVEEVSSSQWKVIADSSDRRPWIAGVDLGPAIALHGLPPNELREAERLLAEKKEIEKQIRSLQAADLAFAGKFRIPDEIHVLSRGDPEQPREEVPPSLPEAFSSQAYSKELPEQERRIKLAEWIASSENPLTSRVIVNRIWQGHFGLGLVETPNDFGRSGAKPSHPELLDWLAHEFIRSGWSIKWLHRKIVLSGTYRQASNRHDPKASSLDASVRWLWRYPTRRLEAEAIRDSILSVSGELSHVMFGRGFDLFDKRGGLSGFTPVESFRGEGLKRMIYAHKIRRERDAIFGVFDCPDAGQSTSLRRESTTALQSLSLFNSRLTLEQSEALAARIRTTAGEDATKQVREAFRMTYLRSPEVGEQTAAEHVVREHGLPALCRALLNSNEFLYIP